MPYSRFPFFYQPNFYNRYSGPNRPYSNNVQYQQKNLNNNNSSLSYEYNNSYDGNYSSTNQYKNSYNNNRTSYNSPKSSYDDDIYSNRYNNSYNDNSKKNLNIIENNITSKDSDKKNNSKRSNDTDSYFFELFGLKLYFDDILLISLIFFLYEEGVKDDELFISLILLLLS